MEKRLVWDLPLRLFHWLLVLLLGASWLTAELDRMSLHFYSGYALATLLLFRVMWGLAGPRYARFAGFVAGPREVWRYLRGWLAGSAREPAGHTPPGGWMTLALLALVAVQVSSGMLNSHDGLDAGPWYWAAGEPLRELAEDAHEVAFNLLLAFAAAHVAAVLLYRLRPGIDLIGPMFSGRKATAEPPIAGSRLALAGVLLVAAAASVWLLVSSAPPPSMSDLGLY